jgi:hypothetical protein
MVGLFAAAVGLFTGYAQSLDMYVDFTYRELTALSLVLIALLVVEVRLVPRTGHVCLVSRVPCNTITHL